MSGETRGRRRSGYQGPNTDAELSAYRAGARAAHKADHGPFLSARSGVLPVWRFTPQELEAVQEMHRGLACEWFLRGWSEETARLGEADLPTEEEE